jgi:hypothetical protein
MNELEILERLQQQMDDLLLESHSPIEEALRNAVAILISVLRKKFAEE